MIEQLGGFADGVVAVRASREITKADYQEVFIPAVEAALQAQGQIALYYETAPTFTGYSLGAIEEDAVLGLGHMFQFRRAAVVSDVGWIRTSIAAFRPLIPCPVRLYRHTQAALAKQWIESSED